MNMRCAVFGHAAGTRHHHNQGLDFATCHECGCDLIRPLDGSWSEVPRGFRIVWREFGRAGDAASVAARMSRTAPPPRRALRNARPALRRDSRSRPLAGTAAMIGLLGAIGRVLEADRSEMEDASVDPKGQYVICLPGGGGR